MNDLLVLINTFSEKEKDRFVRYLQKKNRRTDVKNLVLFRLLRKGITKDLDVKLYGKPAKNSFYALKKRLYDAIIDYIATQSFEGETNEELEILKFLLASRIFFENKQYKIAFKTLAKAERMALQLDVYSILTEIYQTKIQYAHFHPTYSLPDLITVARTNLVSFQQEQELNMVYASIKTKLRSQKNLSIELIIREAFDAFELQLNDSLSFKSLFQLTNIATTAAELQTDYYQILPFLETIYSIVEQKQDLAHKHRFYQIEILYLLAYAYFRNHKFTSSQKFIEQLNAIIEFEGDHFKKRFGEKILTLHILNLNYTGKAIEALQLSERNKNSSLELDLTYATCLFQQDQFSEAYAVLKQMHHSDRWYEKKMGFLWVTKKRIIELLTLIELDKLDVVLSRFNSFERSYFPRLKAIGEDRVNQFMRLVKHSYENPGVVTSESFRDRVGNKIVWKEKQQEDLFVMSFYAWLKAKMEQKPLYETTLQLIKNN